MRTYTVVMGQRQDAGVNDRRSRVLEFSDCLIPISFALAEFVSVLLPNSVSACDGPILRSSFRRVCDNFDRGNKAWSVRSLGHQNSFCDTRRYISSMGPYWLYRTANQTVFETSTAIQGSRYSY